MSAFLLAALAAHAADTVPLSFEPGVTSARIAAASSYIQVATFSWNEAPGAIRCRKKDRTECEVTWNHAIAAVKSADSRAGIRIGVSSRGARTELVLTLAANAPLSLTDTVWADATGHFD